MGQSTSSQLGVVCGAHVYEVVEEGARNVANQSTQLVLRPFSPPPPPPFGGDADRQVVDLLRGFCRGEPPPDGRRRLPTRLRVDAGLERPAYLLQCLVDGGGGGGPPAVARTFLVSHDALITRDVGGLVVAHLFPGLHVVPCLPTPPERAFLATPAFWRQPLRTLVGNPGYWNPRSLFVESDVRTLLGMLAARIAAADGLPLARIRQATLEHLLRDDGGGGAPLPPMPPVLRALPDQSCIARVRGSLGRCAQLVWVLVRLDEHDLRRIAARRPPRDFPLPKRCLAMLVDGEGGGGAGEAPAPTVYDPFPAETLLSRTERVARWYNVQGLGPHPAMRQRYLRAAGTMSPPSPPLVDISRKRAAEPADWLRVVRPRLDEPPPPPPPAPDPPNRPVSAAAAVGDVFRLVPQEPRPRPWIRRRRSPPPPPPPPMAAVGAARPSSPPAPGRPGSPPPRRPPPSPPPSDPGLPPLDQSRRLREHDLHGVSLQTMRDSGWWGADHWPFVHEHVLHLLRRSAQNFGPSHHLHRDDLVREAITTMKLDGYIRYNDRVWSQPHGFPVGDVTRVHRSLALRAELLWVLRNATREELALVGAPGPRPSLAGIDPDHRRMFCVMMGGRMTGSERREALREVLGQDP